MRNANIVRIRGREREWDSWWRYEASREALMRAGEWEGENGSWVVSSRLPRSLALDPRLILASQGGKVDFGRTRKHNEPNKQPLTVSNRSSVSSSLTRERERERKHRTLTIDRISFSPKNNQTTRKLTTADICIAYHSLCLHISFSFFFPSYYYHSMMGNLFNRDRD